MGFGTARAGVRTGRFWAVFFTAGFREAGRGVRGFAAAVFRGLAAVFARRTVAAFDFRRALAGTAVLALALVLAGRRAAEAAFLVLPAVFRAAAEPARARGADVRVRVAGRRVAVRAFRLAITSVLSVALTLSGK